MGKYKFDEIFYVFKSDVDYGWLFCYLLNGKIFVDLKFKCLVGCKNVLFFYVYFFVYLFVLGFDYFDDLNMDDIIKNFFLVVLYGFMDVMIGYGYKIVIMWKG